MAAEPSGVVTPEQASCSNPSPPLIASIQLLDANGNPFSASGGFTAGTTYKIAVSGPEGSYCASLTQGGTFNSGGTQTCQDTSFPTPTSPSGTLTVSVISNGGSTIAGSVTAIDNCTGAVDATMPFSFGPGLSLPPPPTAGLYVWLKGDAGVTAPSNKVTHWVDQSGNGHHASMATLARQPLFIPNAVNGFPVIEFSGAQSLVFDVFPAPTTYTVFVVGKNNLATQSFNMILGAAGNSPNHQLRWDSATTALFVANNAGVIRTSTIGDTHVFHALAVRYDGSTLTFFRDANATSSSTFTATQPWTIGQIGAWFSQNFLTGDIAEILIYNAAISESARQQVYLYLRNKYRLP